MTSAGWRQDSTHLERTLLIGSNYYSIMLFLQSEQLFLPSFIPNKASAQPAEDNVHKRFFDDHVTMSKNARVFLPEKCYLVWNALAYLAIVTNAKKKNRFEQWLQQAEGRILPMWSALY